MDSGDNFKITISAYGKFDLFRWAEGFQKKGLLFRLLTDFYGPKNKFLSWRRKDNEIIDLNKVKTFIFPRFLRLLKKWTIDYQHYENYLFDWWASKKLVDSDLIITRSSCALKTLQKAKKLNIKSVLYRGSSHIEFQKEITEEEYRLWKVPFRGNIISEKAIKRELQEYELCDYLYTPSSFAAETYMKRGIPKNKIVYFSLSSEKFANLNTNEKTERMSKFQILYIGEISLRKGAQYLLEAVKEIKSREGNKIELVLIGSLSEEFKPILERYKGSFTYLGIIPHHKVADYYKGASVFVFPSIDDGFGQVIFEAMSFGLPVITTENTGGPDVIKNGKDGFVVPIRNSEIIADKIITLYKDGKLRQEMGEQAKIKIQKYSVDNFIDKWLETFNKLGWLK